MKLLALHVAGFGRLADRRFTFAPGFNVVYGSNESGKSTLANAIVATLYGAERKKELWRPWSGAPFATTLTYELANGERIEIQREFERDAKGVRAYDAAGNDLTATAGAGRRFVPGEAHLHLPLEVFVNAACIRQTAVAIDDGKDAAGTAAHLAQALDGGPREDAALGAIARLDDALRAHVGTERARKNAPLRALRAQADERRAALAAARERLRALDDVRQRIARAHAERDRLASALHETDRRARAAHAAAAANRLAELRDFRTELAALQAGRAAYDDVADVADDAESAVSDAFYAWESADRSAAAAEAHAAALRLTAEERAELAARAADAGSIDDVTYAALRAAAAGAEAARLHAATAGAEAEAAQRAVGGPRAAAATAVAAVAALCGAGLEAAEHAWLWAAVAVALGACLIAAALGLWGTRVQRQREARRRSDHARELAHGERVSAATVAAVLVPLGLRDIDELTRHRERWNALRARASDAAAAADAARVARAAAAAAAQAFDRCASPAAPDARGDRAGIKAAVAARAARKRQRDGIDAHLSALELRKSMILGADDEYTLECELAAFARAGVEPAGDGSPAAVRAIDAARTELADALRVAAEAGSRLEGELTAAEAQLPDLAALDERCAQLDAEIARLEAFERAVGLAKATLERRTQEAHRAFARRLETYAAQTLTDITAGRYGGIFVDPATLAIRVRVPETGAIVDLDALSAGTRDQTYLVVRIAMARMFAEGLETPPLLFDDPFAYWDTERIERCVPILARGAPAMQAIVLTASEELAAAAVAHGAHRIDLAAPALI